MVAELKEILIKEAQLNGDMQKVKTIENATILSDLKYTFTDAIKKLKEVGVTIVLTEEEKERRFDEIKKAKETVEEGFDNAEYYENGLTNGLVNMRGFASTSDIIMVHKTDFSPKGEKIESRYSGEVLDDCSVTLGGKSYNFTCKSGRDTVHFSANHEVSANSGGNWSKMKYAVLIPFDDLKKNSTIINAKAVDTYTKGAANLTENAYILCPKGESRAIQQENPNVTIIEYEGESVQGYANMLILELGYKLELGNDHGLEDSKQATKYYDIMTKEGLAIYNHFYSEDKKREMELGKVYQVVGIMKLLSDEKIIEKVDRKVLIEDLNSQYFYELTDSSFQEKYSCFNILKEELKKIGMNISKDDLKDVLDAHTNEHDFLDMSIESIVIGYMLDVASKKRIAKDIEKPQTEDEFS